MTKDNANDQLSNIETGQKVGTDAEISLRRRIDAGVSGTSASDAEASLRNRLDARTNGQTTLAGLRDKAGDIGSKVKEHAEKAIIRGQILSDDVQEVLGDKLLAAQNKLDARKKDIKNHATTYAIVGLAIFGQVIPTELSPRIDTPSSASSPISSLESGERTPSPSSRKIAAPIVSESRPVREPVHPSGPVKETPDTLDSEERGVELSDAIETSFKHDENAIKRKSGH